MMGLTGQSLAVGVESTLRNRLSNRTPSMQLVMGGANGLAYTSIKKGTGYYQTVIDSVAGLGGSDICPGVFVVHGEKDMDLNTPQATYEGYLAEWLDDYQTDIVAETGQSETPFMIVTQVSSWPNYGSEPTIALAQLEASLDLADLHLVGPMYAYGYNPDEVHLTSLGYNRLGQMLNRVLTDVLASAYAGPLRPLSAVRSAATITVQFDVPEGVLAFDTTLVASQTNRGFTYVDDTSSATISSVALGGDGTSVVITLSGTPSGSNPKVRYGYASQYGNLRDTSADTYVDGAGMHNWCVHFSQAVTT